MSEWFKKFRKWCNKHEGLIFLLGLVVLFRIPSLFEPHHYGDEEIYFVMGRAWREGVGLYSGAFDHKPPFIYILAGIAKSVFNMRLILLSWMSVHTVIFWQVARWFWGELGKKVKAVDFKVFLSTLVFVVLTTIPALEGNIANGELFMMMPLTAGLLLAVKAKEKEYLKYLGAGVLAGLGLMFKIPVVFDFVAIVAWLFLFQRKGFFKGLKGFLNKRLWLMVLGFLVPIGLSFLYYYNRGVGEGYFRGVFLINLGYTSSYATSSFKFNPFQSGLFVRGMVLGGFSLALYALKEKIDKKVVFVSLWLGFSLFGAFLSERPYPHYLHQPAVPFSLVFPLMFTTESVLGWLSLGAVLAGGVWGLREFNFWSYPTVSYYRGFVGALNNEVEEFKYYYDNSRRNFEVAEYLNERMRKEDKLYVWGSDSTIYNLTEKLPAGGKYIVSFHVRDFEAWDSVMENLEENKPKFIVKLPDSIEFKQLERFLERKYVKVKGVEGTEVFLRLEAKLKR